MNLTLNLRKELKTFTRMHIRSPRVRKLKKRRLWTSQKNAKVLETKGWKINLSKNSECSADK